MSVDPFKEVERLRAETEKLAEALRKIDDGYGPNHLSKFCRDVARTALAAWEAAQK